MKKFIGKQYKATKRNFDIMDDWGDGGAVIPAVSTLAAVGSLVVWGIAGMVGEGYAVWNVVRWVLLSSFIFFFRGALIIKWVGEFLEECEKEVDEEEKP